MASETAPQAAPPGLARNAMHLGIGQVLTTALTMVLSAAIARSLGAAEFGLMYLVTSIATFSYVFVDWGHGPYVTREVARHPERAGELLGSVLVVRIGTALLMCVLAVGITTALGYDARTRLFAAILILGWLPPYLALTYSWIFRGRERMAYDAGIQVVNKASNLVVMMTVLLLGGRLGALLSFSAVAGFITLGVAVPLYRRLQLPPVRFTSATAWELIRDGAPMLAISLAVAVQPYIDANLLYKLTTPEVMGWYGAAWVIAGTLVAPATVLGATLYPRLSRVSADPEQFSRTVRLAFRPLLWLAVLGAVGVYQFADVAIGLIYSEQKFGPAADIVRAFAPALLLIYVDMVFGHAILAVGRAAQLARAKIVAVCVTTGVELLLIPFFQSHYGNGGIGAVLAMATGELVMVTAAILLIRDFVSGGMVTDLIRALGAGVATVLVLRLAPSLTPFLGIPLCVAVYAVVSVMVGLIRRADLELLVPGLARRGAVV